MPRRRRPPPGAPASAATENWCTPRRSGRSATASLAGEFGRALVDERVDALAEIVRLLEQAVREPLHLEPELQRPVVGKVQDPLRHGKGERRHLAQLRAKRGGRGIYVVGDLRDEPQRQRLFGADPASAHDHVLGASEADHACKTLRPSRARDHPDRRLRQRELDVGGSDAKVARERELEPDAEDVSLERGDHRLPATLGCGDVVRQARHRPRGGCEESGDVTAGRECASRAGEDDEANLVSGIQLLEDLAQLLAREHRHAVELAGNVERDPGDVAVALHAKPLVAQTSTSCVASLSSLRRILPLADFGSSATRRYSRGRLNRASSEARQCASSSSGVAEPTTQAVTCWPNRSSGTPATATSSTPGCRARTLSTSSGWMFSPPLITMSSTRPSTQRSPSSSIRPMSPVRYQPSHSARSSASGRFQ